MALGLTADTDRATNDELKLSFAFIANNGDMSVVLKANDCVVLKQKTSKITFDIAAPTSHALPAKTTPQANNAPSRRHIFDFLALPRELRDMIYKEALPEFFSHQNKFPNQSIVGFLLANKQVHVELRGHIFNTAPYRLILRPCSSICSCRGDYGYIASRINLNDLLVEPKAANIFKPHFHFPLKLAREHAEALKQFRNIEIDGAIPSITLSALRADPSSSPSAGATR